MGIVVDEPNVVAIASANDTNTTLSTTSNSDSIYTVNTHIGETNNTVSTTLSTSNFIYAVDGRICTQGSSSSAYSRHFSFDKTIYNVLSMRDDMKTITYPDGINNEFDLFLQYAEAKTNGAVDTDFDLFAEYLGSIGITKTICEV